MEIIGIICEYNPFHNGHLYHINKIKELYPDSIIILVMSGYFTERGDISLISKYNKTRIALNYGVDLVIDLPTLYATNSSDYFGEYAVNLLSKVGCKKLVFGSEKDDIKNLINIAKYQLDNENDMSIKEYLDKGLNYPSAISKASGVKLLSNDILGLSYIKAILKNNYDIEPITIKRTNDFNDTTLDDEIVSANNIREKLKLAEDIKKYIPHYDYSYINQIDEDKLFLLLKYKIITARDLSLYLGVDEGIENKLKKEILASSSIDELINKIKSKRYTYVRLRRMLIHILLGIYKDDVQIESPIHILGFNKKGQKYLKSINIKNEFYKSNTRIEEIERQASLVYSMLTSDESVNFEKLNRPITID